MNEGQQFFNDEAFEMCIWSYEESNLNKAKRIYRVALKMEERYRRKRNIPLNHQGVLIGSHAYIWPRNELTAKSLAIHKKRHSDVKVKVRM